MSARKGHSAFVIAQQDTTLVVHNYKRGSILTRLAFNLALNVVALLHMLLVLVLFLLVALLFYALLICSMVMFSPCAPTILSVLFRRIFARICILGSY